jgi:hypothetical protein
MQMRTLLNPIDRRSDELAVIQSKPISMQWTNELRRNISLHGPPVGRSGVAGPQRVRRQNAYATLCANHVRGEGESARHVPAPVCLQRFFARHPHCKALFHLR